MSQDQQKLRAAEAALDFIESDMLIGIGTGSTANHFIDQLSKVKGRIDAAVASSDASAARLKTNGIRVLELNVAGPLPLYVDGADESNKYLHLIKGGGGALTREKVIAAASEKFICIADESKLVDKLGSFPLPVEVIPMARSYVARELLKLGGQPEYRDGFVTDNGNQILDVHNLDIQQPQTLEGQINNIAGVVCVGLFALKPADVLILGTESGIRSLEV